MKKCNVSEMKAREIHLNLTKARIDGHCVTCDLLGVAASF